MKKTLINNKIFNLIVLLILLSCTQNSNQFIENKINELTPYKKEIIQLINKDLIRIDGGEFLMGCDTIQNPSICNENNKPGHKVRLSSFKIGKFEVTQAIWFKIMGKNPSNFSKTGYLKDSVINYSNNELKNLPVEFVSWLDIDTFFIILRSLTGLKYRLPTEAEWEYVASDKGTSKYNYVGSNIIEEVAWCKINSMNKTHPVGLKKPNKLGIFDLSGNVSEWCLDNWTDKYNNFAQINPIAINESKDKVIRGGNFSNLDFSTKPKLRAFYVLNTRNQFYGFRIVLED